MLHVTCHMCHMSHVTCHGSFVNFFFFSDKMVELVGGGSVIKGPTPSSFSVFETFFSDTKTLNITQMPVHRKSLTNLIPT